jgi:hypothetical protein
MVDNPNNLPEEEPQPAAAGGKFDAGRDIQAGRDIAGRDIAGRDIAGGDIVTVGFSQQAVTRLVLIVGMLVFVTAACFFSGGIALGAGVFAALNRPVETSPEAALSMQSKLQQIQSLPSNQPFSVVFSEPEMNSYFHYVLGPQIGVSDGKLRFLPDEQLAISGQVEDLGGRQAAAVLDVQEETGQTLSLSAAAVKVVGSQNSRFGWVAVPTPLLAPLQERINQNLTGNYEITAVESVQNPNQNEWMVQGVTR